MDSLDLCCFCNILERKKIILPRLNIKDYSSLEEHIILESDNFFVKTEVTAIKPYHFLIISKVHIGSFYEICQQITFKKELEEIIIRIGNFYKNNLNLNILLYEHGNTCNVEFKSSCIDHAHIHTIPIELEYINKVKIDIFKNLGAPIDKPMENYFYLRDSYNQEFYWEDEVYISQYFRKIICKNLSCIERDKWKNCAIKNELRKDSIKWHLMAKNIKI